ncbi:MAG: hypothetical protein QME16_00090 [Planctomycetota bacterium]|nr:hypothetical protein [Planctomycetota bacterium]
MIELSKYIYENYPGLKNRFAYWQILSLLDKNEDKVITVKDGDKFLGAAMYARVTDDTLWKLQYGFMKVDNPQDALQMLSEKGQNIHFLYLLAGGAKIILRGLREVVRKENPKTISWLSPDMSKLNIWKGRGVLCLR